ncbi:MAG: phosphatase PAP2 family protein [Bdellovibrionota bacterium]
MLFDQKILLAVQKWRRPLLNKLFLFLTYSGTAKAWLAGTAAKKLIPRNRPSEAIFGYARVIESPTCGSFPSSHTAAAVAFYSALQFISHPLASFVGVWALLVSFSRLYLGVHYLTDIIGGAVLGTIIAIIFIWFVFL